MGGTTRDLLTLTSLALITCAAAAPNPNYQNADISPQDIFNVDVCVIGGGAAGTYAAIKSKDFGKSVVVVERQNRLGGHTNTYIDPVTNKSVEIGVALYQDTPIVQNFFKRFNVPLYQYNSTLPGVISEYADFSTGDIASPKAGDLMGAWDRFQEQVAKYPFLDYDLSSVPYPVPADLLLPFGDFIKKYQLQDVVPYLSLFGQGWGNFVTIPTLNAIKYFPPSFFSPATFFSGGPGAVAAKDNSLIYDRATAELGINALLSSSVLSMDRSGKDVKIVVQTPTGKKYIRAQRLISAIPPVLNNLKGYDLSSAEIPVFNKFRGHSWYVGLIKNTGIPDTTTLINYGTNNIYNLPILPGVYDFFATVLPGVHYFLYGGNDNQTTFTENQIKTDLQQTLARLASKGSIPAPSPSANTTLDIIDFANHSPYELVVKPEEIAKGYYNRLFALQGQRNTYWTGAAFVTQGSAPIWNFTDELVTKMWATPATQPVSVA